MMQRREERAGGLRSASGSQPSCESVLWPVLRNSLFLFFFFLEGEQHELSKSADGSKSFWVVKCQEDGNKQSGIY